MPKMLNKNLVKPVIKGDAKLIFSLQRMTCKYGMSMTAFYFVF